MTGYTEADLLKGVFYERRKTNTESDGLSPSNSLTVGGALSERNPPVAALPVGALPYAI